MQRLRHGDPTTGGPRRRNVAGTPNPGPDACKAGFYRAARLRHGMILAATGAYPTESSKLGSAEEPDENSSRRTRRRPRVAVARRRARLCGQAGRHAQCRFPAATTEPRLAVLAGPRGPA